MNVTKKLNLGYVKRLNKLLMSFSLKNYITTTIIIVAIFLIIFIFFWDKSEKYSVLYNNLSIEDKKSIVKELIDMNIPYRIEESSGTILVPKNKEYIFQLSLIKKDFPKQLHAGYELLDKEGFGISQFNEQINYQRALEGELENTIQKLNNIRYAKVHLSLPKSSLFLYDNKKPSAAVSLIIDNDKEIGYEEVKSIVYLVSSSISGLSLKNITIIDQYGHLLNKSEKEYNIINNDHLKYSTVIEEEYIRKVKGILVPLFGLENVCVKVTAQINFDTKDYTEEVYHPNNFGDEQSIRSRHKFITQKMIPDNNSQYFLNKRLKNIDSLKKKNISKKYSGNYKNKYQKNQEKIKKNDLNVDLNSEDTINYELNKIILHSIISKGEVKRISVAVAINYLKTNTGKFVPLNVLNIKKVKKLIQRAIGYSKKRGDSVEVLNSLFFKPELKTKGLKHNNVNDYITLNKTFNIFFYLIIICVILLSIILCILIFRKKIVYNEFDNFKYRKENISNVEKKAKVVFEKNRLLSKKTRNIPKILEKIKDIYDSDSQIIATIIRHWINKKL